MPKPINYLDVDEFGPYTVRCMSGCGQTIAKRKTIKTSQGQKQVIVHNVTSRRYQIKIEDKSVANMLICKKCLDKGPPDLALFEATMHEGWRKTQDAVYKKKSSKEYDTAMKRVEDMKKIKKVQVN